jgi:hypothetical protein
MATAALAILCDLPIEAIERAMVQEDVGTTLIVTKAIGFSGPLQRQSFCFVPASAASPARTRNSIAPICTAETRDRATGDQISTRSSDGCPPTHRPAPFALTISIARPPSQAAILIKRAGECLQAQRRDAGRWSFRATLGAQLAVRSLYQVARRYDNGSFSS